MKELCTMITSWTGKWMYLTLIAALLICSGQNLKAQESLKTNLSSEEKADKLPYQAEAVIVTAQKREENVQDISDSITVLDELDISDAGITDMVSLSTYVPNFEFYNFGSRWHSQTYIRGIKTLNNSEPSTGLYVDGVNYSKSYLFDFPLFDVERVEVLRGPQGTLYGRNTMAGVINIHTRTPDNETRAQISGTYASDNEKTIQGQVQTPILKDKLFLGISGLISSSHGYMENDIDGVGEDGRHKDGQAGRIKLRYLPAPKWDITLGLDAQHHDDGAFPFRRTQRNSFVNVGILEADGPYHYSHDFDGTSENDFWGTTLNTSVDTTIGKVTSITGYRDFNNEDIIDSDFSPLDAARMKYLLQESSFSQELRIASPENKTGPKWLAGIYYFHINSDKERINYYRSAMANSPSNPFAPGTGARKTQSKGTNFGEALFGQITWPVFNTLDITTGLRYEIEDAQMDATIFYTPEGGATSATQQPYQESRFTALLPKLSVGWHFMDDKMLYTTVSRAHRSGGFNDPSVGGDPYDEEYSWVYEAGIKSGFFQNRLTINICGFYTDIEDEQLTRFDEYNQSYLENAGESHRLGMEFEAGWFISKDLEIFASLTWVEAEYDKYTDPVTGQDFQGNTTFGVPDYTYTLGFQYRRPLWGEWNVFCRAEVAGTGRRFFDDTNTVKEPGYEVVNLKLGLEGTHWDGYVWAKNLFDRHYCIFENVDRGITEDGKPLTIGITLSYRF
nr:TonB-dependent receptor [uncultured Desulfobacter sp.]